MHPKLFEIFGLPVYSFGLMLGTSFIVASLLLTSELKRKKLDPELGSTITLIALFAGVAGSKILYLIENWTFFIADPVGMAFSPVRAHTVWGVSSCRVMADLLLCKK